MEKIAVILEDKKLMWDSQLHNKSINKMGKDWLTGNRPNIYKKKTKQTNKKHKQMVNWRKQI